jgi:hypothetical protein
MPRKIQPQRASGSKRIKAPESAEVGSTNNLHPIFCLHYMDEDFGLSKCEKDEKVALIEKLRILSQLTWKDIFNQGKYQSGFEKISRNSIRGKIPTFITEDVESFIAFRFDGKNQW